MPSETRNNKGVLLVIGANYHTTWQTYKGMRFVLHEIDGNNVKLKTRTTNKCFNCNANDLLLITSSYNLSKIKRLKTKILRKLIEELKGLKRWDGESDEDNDFDLIPNKNGSLIRSSDLDEIISKLSLTITTYKPGDNVRVLRKLFGNPFNYGEEIILSFKGEDDNGVWSAIQTNGNIRGWITEEEFELIK